MDLDGMRLDEIARVWSLHLHLVEGIERTPDEMIAYAQAASMVDPIALLEGSYEHPQAYNRVVQELRKGKYGIAKHLAKDFRWAEFPCSQCGLVMLLMSGDSVHTDGNNVYCQPCGNGLGFLTYR